MKSLSGNQVIELLAELGLDVQLAEEGKEEKEFKASELVAEVATYLKPGIEESYVKENEPKLHAKFMGEARSQITKEFGIKRNDLDNKSWKEMLDLVKAVNKPNDNEWQAKYEQLVKDYEVQDEERNTEAATKEQEWLKKLELSEKKYIDRDIDGELRKYVEKMPRKGGDVAEQTEVLRYKLEKAGFELKLINNAVEFWKDNKKHKGEEVIKPIAEKIFPIANDMSHVDPAKVKAGTETKVGEGVAQIPSEYNAIAQWAEGEAAA